MVRQQFAKLRPGNWSCGFDPHTLRHGKSPHLGWGLFPWNVLYWAHMEQESVEINEALVEQGDTVFSWLIDEYERHERGPVWYAVSFLVGVSLILYALVVQNFLFAIIIVMFGVIIGLSSLREPQRMLFQITTRGVFVGDHFTSYRDMKDFWIVYEPPYVKNLYLEYKNALTPRIVVPIEDGDPVEIRRALLDFLDENGRSEEPLGDLMGRVLKL